LQLYGETTSDAVHRLFTAIFSGSMLRSLFVNGNLFAARSIGLFNAGHFQHRYQEPTFIVGTNPQSLALDGAIWLAN
jgi:hypothetical protein